MDESKLAQVDLVTFIPAEDYKEAELESQTQEIEAVPDWEQTMQALSTPGTRLTVPRNQDFSRKQVVNAFNNAFELIGGVPRLALWAHANEGDFYKLFARLLPSQASQALGESNELIIKHILPRGKLDE